MDLWQKRFNEFPTSDPIRYLYVELIDCACVLYVNVPA